MNKLKIQDREVGDEAPVFIIAELSANHCQKKEVAEQTIRAAKEVGADAIKLQTYTADTLTIDCDNEYFKIKTGGLWDGKTLHQLYKEAYTPWEWQPSLKKLAESLGLICFSSPFDHSSVAFLEKMDVPAYKIASFEITDLPLIEEVASKQKPVILSTGIATRIDIEEAVNACRKAGNEQIILLKCTSSYPAPYEESNLRTIPHLVETFKTIVGLSDHTLGLSTPIAAVALGAKVIEKHFIIDKKLKSPDAAFSLDPMEFELMVKAVRDAEKSLGKVSYDLSERVLKNKVFARSLFVIKDVKAGDVFTAANLRSIRPGYGISPKHLAEIIGKKAKHDIGRGTPFRWEFVN